MNNARQVAVVMFSDVVGYTALMGDNEEAALVMLQQNHQLQKTLIQKYGLPSAINTQMENGVKRSARVIHCSTILSNFSLKFMWP